MPWNWDTNQPYGAYKKILIPQQKLKEEIEILKPSLLELKKKYQSRQIKEEEVAFEFFWFYYSHRNKENLFNTKQKLIPTKENILEFLKIIRFRNIPDTIRIVLLNWFSKKWKILLLDYNPTPYEMLSYQSNGIRIVTIDWECAIKGEFVFGIRDAFEHFLHDFEHCYNFYREEYLYSEQSSFFRKLLSFYPEIEIFFKVSIAFKKKWEYLISDMNSHPEHLKQYTKAILYEFFDNYENQLLPSITEKIKTILETL